MKKKVVFLPYDFDTALGINNEGVLAFGYDLEDIDTTDAGADVYNGQKSVLWKNCRDAFGDNLKEMYQNFRSDGSISYEKVRKMFEEHQSKWSESIFNEDAWFKYVLPLIEKGTAVYLPMLQGSKEGQRNWWMYYRFRYLDSKYNAGDSLKDFITLRGYAKANFDVELYASIYLTVKFGSYLLQQRGTRGNTYTVECPLDNVNDTEIYIYDASLLSSVGDLSGLKVGFADFSKATKLLTIKLGDASETYENSNLKEFYAGNNTLLHTVDLRNCSKLAQAIDLSGCTNIEYVYLDGTAVTGCKLPSGGILKVLHLPSTITGLEIVKQPKITELVIPDYSNIATLRLEYVGNIVDSKSILSNMVVGGRVRLIGFNYTFESVSAINTFYDLLDAMRGLDENGNNVDTAQLMGTINVDSLTGSELLSLQERQPNITINYNHITSYLYYYNYDGSSLLYTETIQDGGNGTYSGTPSRSSTAQYTYTFAGWSTTPNGEAETDSRNNVTADRNVYAAYTATVRKYTVYFYNKSSGSTVTLQTVYDVPYGGNASYTGSTPVDAQNNMPFTGWSPEPTNITGNTYCYAQFESPVEIIEITDTWEQIVASVNDGTYATKYKLGNYKPLDLGSEGIVNMQIVGVNVDTKADGTGTAPLTWMSRELLTTKKKMNTSLSTVNDYSGVKDAWAYNDSTKKVSTNKNIGNGVPSTDNQEMIVKCSFTITATDEQDFTFKVVNYGNDSATHFLNVKIDGETSSYSEANSTSYKNITLTAGQVVNVELEYNCLSNSFWYSASHYGFAVTLSSTTNNFVVGSFTTDEANTKTTPYKEGTGSIGGWEKCSFRTYLGGTIKPLIPEVVRNAIVLVTKNQDSRDTDGLTYAQTTNDSVWIPGVEEISSSGLYKTIVKATGKTDDYIRIKKVVGTTESPNWWLRDSANKQEFKSMMDDGSYYTDYSYYENGVCLCFCM